jgi:chromate transporter
LPPFIVVILLAPSVRCWSQDAGVKAFVNGVTAAAAEAIAGAALVLARRAINDLPTASLAAVTLLVLMKVRKVPEPLLILAVGGAGLVLRRIGGAH